MSRPFNSRIVNQTMTDWWLILSVLGLMFTGFFFIYSAKYLPSETNDFLSWQGGFGEWFQSDHNKQLIWYLIGAGAATLICLIDYRILSRWSAIAYWLTIFLLILVMIPGIGKIGGGARRWFDLKVFMLQPSEFAKLTFILLLAQFLSRPRKELALSGNFWRAVGIIALPFVLILMEPDLGSSIVFIPIGLTMMLVAGIPLPYLGVMVGSVTIAAAILIGSILFLPPEAKVKKFIKLKPYQEDRLRVFIGRDYYIPPDATERERGEIRRKQWEASHNVRQAMISVGSGGKFGTGWCNGTQNYLGFLPKGVAHNDFVFSVIAEEKGFAGSVAVLVLYLIFILSGLMIAAQARDILGRAMAVGVVTLFFSQTFINIGMNIRIMPVTGIPLPLISYGGSSVLSSMIGVGILLNVHRYRRSY